MSERTELLYLQDILDSGTAIQSYVEGCTLELFEKDRMRQSAVIREFEIIGEAVGKLPESMKAAYTDVPWQDIKDFRNLLVHEYFGVDLELVWNTVCNDLPILLDTIRRLMVERSSIP
jgi:uncharacterized protein with HEPN domain